MFLDFNALHHDYSSIIDLLDNGTQKIGDQGQKKFECVVEGETDKNFYLSFFQSYTHAKDYEVADICEIWKFDFGCGKNCDSEYDLTKARNSAEVIALISVANAKRLRHLCFIGIIDKDLLNSSRDRALSTPNIYLTDAADLETQCIVCDGTLLPRTILSMTNLGSLPTKYFHSLTKTVGESLRLGHIRKAQDKISTDSAKIGFSPYFKIGSFFGFSSLQYQNIAHRDGGDFINHVIAEGKACYMDSVGSYPDLDIDLELVAGELPMIVKNFSYGYDSRNDKWFDASALINELWGTDVYLSDFASFFSNIRGHDLFSLAVCNLSSDCSFSCSSFSLSKKFFLFASDPVFLRRFQSAPLGTQLVSLIC